MVVNLRSGPMSDDVKNAPKGVDPLSGVTLVRRQDAARFLWGDERSGQVADLIYGRNANISALVFQLRPGGYFRSSDDWKSYFDQHRFYYVLEGELAIQDPSTGDVVLASAGQAVHWKGAKWHFGYNFSSEVCSVLDWYAPQERPPHVTELEFGKTKPEFTFEHAGRNDLLGQWPDRLRSERDHAESTGGMAVASRENALHFIHGIGHPILESVYLSTGELTAGVASLMAGSRSDDRIHNSHKIIFVTEGTLHVYLPDSFDWYELAPWDVLYLPPDTKHQYWNYSSKPVSFAFKVVGSY
jgi:quercetin dioxygenase-like cupin family protein